jgi:hypothetical protein
MNGVSDVRQWRIRPDTPATSIEELDYEQLYLSNLGELDRYGGK